MAVTRTEDKLRPLILRKREDGTYLAGNGEFPVVHDFSIKTMFLSGAGVYSFERVDDEHGLVTVKLKNATGVYEVDVPENLNDLCCGQLVNEEYHDG